MEQLDTTLIGQPEQPQRSQFLKVLCILSFVLCGLWLFLFLLASVVCFSLGEETISAAWEKVKATQPLLANTDPVYFFRQIGKLCMYSFVANAISLMGVIMMWRLNRTGFFIYVRPNLRLIFWRWLLIFRVMIRSMVLSS